MNQSAVKELVRRFLATFRPPERITASQEAERHRRLSSEYSAKGGGKFSFDEAPWQREILDAPDEPGIRTVVMVFASQTTGKTETQLNMVAHRMKRRPCSIFVLLPTLELATKWSFRLAAMIRDNPGLRTLVRDPRSRDSGNTLFYKRYAGGEINLAGANSPASLSSMPIAFLIADEIDSNPDSAGTEGDPLSIARKRQESFSDAVEVLVSAPKKPRGQSKIEAYFDDSDKRYWFVECPGCRKLITFEWEMVKWLNDDPETAWMECACGYRIDDETRRAMIHGGRWVPTATPKVRGIRGYHLNGLYCLFRPQKPYATRLEQFVGDYLKEKAGGKLKLQVWENLFLARSHVEEGRKLDETTILARREHYGPKLPAEVIVLTCAVDVQRDRLEVELKGWGEQEESWGIEFRTFTGNTQRPKVWEALDGYLLGEWEREDGARLKISITGIDTGDGKTQKAAYAFIRPREIRRVVACKGSSTPNAPLVRRTQPNKKNPVPMRVRLYIIGTDTAKATLFERLELEDTGPRYMHFPCGEDRLGDTYAAAYGYDEEFFAQLTAETVVEVNGKRVWTKTRPRNEALDLQVLHLAVRDILNPRLDQIQKQLLASIKPVDENAPASEEKPVRKPKEYILRPRETEPEVTDLRRPERVPGVSRITGRQRGSWMSGGV